MTCIQCGTEMISTTGGDYYCPKCGAALNDSVYRLIDNPSLSHIDTPVREGYTGWVCPKCGKALAPFVSECPCSIPKLEVEC